MHHWSYRLIKGKNSVYIGEAFYNEKDEVMFCSEEPLAVEGFDYAYGFSDYDTAFDVDTAAKDAIVQLKMMLEDIEKYPAVIDPDTDLVGIE
jgi:hypothetical protein